MKQIKGIFGYIFVDGLNAMSKGVFITLIFGTILQQLSILIDIPQFYPIGQVAISLTGVGIGVSVATKYKSSELVCISAAVVGLISGMASSLLDGSLIVEGGILFSGGGEPLGAFIGSMVGVLCGNVMDKKTRLDILIVPVFTLMPGTIVGILVGPTISKLLQELGSWVNWGTEQQPIIMGIVVAVLMGMFLTMPISSAAIGIILNLSGVAAGAATIGCCCNMIGFAVISFSDNGVSGLITQGIGTSMLQISNIMRKPVIWLPVILSSAILGPIGAVVFDLTNSAIGSGMGTAGLVGPWLSWQSMVNAGNELEVFMIIALMCFVLPGLLSAVIAQGMRKIGWIKKGDMRLQL